MQLEDQNQAITAPQIAPQADSKQSDEPKSKRGGKRPGAGRKPNLAKVLLKGVSRNTILAAVENVDVGSIIIGLLRSKREQTRIEALHFIFDRVMGKPKRDLSVTGGVIHAHVRDPFLASLPKEALEALARSYEGEPVQSAADSRGSPVQGDREMNFRGRPIGDISEPAPSSERSAWAKERLLDVRSANCGSQ